MFRSKHTVTGKWKTRPPLSIWSLETGYFGVESITPLTGTGAYVMYIIEEDNAHLIFESFNPYLGANSHRFFN